MIELINSASLLFILLNPFLMSVYLIALIRDLDFHHFLNVMIRAHVISGMAFILFALAGDHIFEDVFKVRFASFLVFGGLVFLLIGIRSVFAGPGVLIETRGNPEHLTGAVTMPFMIAPGTISASVFIGASLEPYKAAIAILLALVASFLSIMLFKYIHDSLHKRNEGLMNRYVEISGRVIALFTGTYAVEMIAKGLEILLHRPL